MFNPYEEFQVTFAGEPVELVGDLPEHGKVYQNATLLNEDGVETSLDHLVTGVTILSSVPDIQTNTCSLQTRRIAEEVQEKNYTFLTISTNTPEELKAWKSDNGLEGITVLSDAEGEFGRKYGLAIKGKAMNTRAVFVTDLAGLIGHIEIVEEATQAPDFDRLFEKAEALNKF